MITRIYEIDKKVKKGNNKNEWNAPWKIEEMNTQKSN